MFVFGLFIQLEASQCRLAAEMTKGQRGFCTFYYEKKSHATQLITLIDSNTKKSAVVTPGTQCPAR